MSRNTLAALLATTADLPQCREEIEAYMLAHAEHVTLESDDAPTGMCWVHAGDHVNLSTGFAEDVL